MTEMLEFILPIFSASNFFFFYYTKGKSSFFTIIGFGIGLLHAILPMQLLNEKLFKIDDPDPNDATYDEAKQEFDTDYARENPATASNARKLFVEEDK